MDEELTSIPTTAVRRAHVQVFEIYARSPEEGREAREEEHEGDRLILIVDATETGLGNRSLREERCPNRLLGCDHLM